MEAVKKMLAQMDEFKTMVEEQKAAAEAAAAEDAAEAAAEAAKNTKLCAAVTAAYIIASADGHTTAEELSHITERLNALTDGGISNDQLNELLAHAAETTATMGRDGAIQNICSTLGSDAERKAAFMVAANVSWTGGGIGAKEGLALQALSGAFGWQMNDMHKLLGQARA